MKHLEKVIRDGNVAVLYSSGFGAGWYTWNTNYPQLLFHPKLVAMVEQGRQSEINEDWVRNEIGIENIYRGGAVDLVIQWLPEGTRFVINEYDGNETLEIVDDVSITA